jgi:thiol-disulfide isomerase/thioredoxin
MRALLLLALLSLFALSASCRPNASREASAAPVQGPHIRFEAAGAGEVSALVERFARSARAEGRLPLVYVGATWCEPCRYFHEAAERGELDAEFPAMALLEFDQDRDGERLNLAGYRSRMIPLFVVPNENGSASERRIEGSIHGPGSPAQIAPRLRAILIPPR